MKITLTKGWELYYVNGATAYEFQVGRYWVRFLKRSYWTFGKTRCWPAFKHLVDFGIEDAD